MRIQRKRSDHRAAGMSMDGATKAFNCQPKQAYSNEHRCPIPAIPSRAGSQISINFPLFLPVLFGLFIFESMRSSSLTSSYLCYCFLLSRIVIPTDLHTYSAVSFLSSKLRSFLHVVTV